MQYLIKLKSHLKLPVDGVDHGVGGDVLHDVVVLQFARALLLQQVALLVCETLSLVCTVHSARATQPFSGTLKTQLRLVNEEGFTRNDHLMRCAMSLMISL